MSSTRYLKPDSDPASAPERYMSDPLISGINVGLRYIGAVASRRTQEQTRAAVWLFNYARLSQGTADALGEKLGMSQSEIRECLTNPNAEPTELVRFVDAVAKLRKEFEAGLPTPAATSVTKRVRMGIREAADCRIFSLIIGAYRIGKTYPFRDEFFRKYMDRAVFVDVPPGGDMRCFTSAFAQALGIAINSSKNNHLIAEQILATIATGVIELVFLDEAQYLWPRDTNKFPEKISFLRHCWDKLEFFRAGRSGIDQKGGLGFAACATPQFADDLNAAIEGKWAAGQFEGRLRRNFCPDTLTQDEVESIARIQAAGFPAEAIRTLVTVTMASPGLLGFLTNVIGKTRFLSEFQEVPITPGLVKEAAQEMLRGTAIERKAKAAAAKASVKLLNQNS